MSKFIDITGYTFGSWYVISYVGYPYWKCQCICGKIEFVNGSHLRRGINTRCRSCASRKYANTYESVTRYLYKKSIKGANKRGFTYELSYTDFLALIRQPCIYCNTKYRHKTSLLAPGYPDLLCSGVDRIDSTQGYTLANTEPCCPLCNIAKMARAKQDFIEWIHRVSDNLRSKETNAE